ncbi:MAG: hypothetical protein K2K95_06885 [Muribaculaceae bacterium]|nr:hypothetical protein [Muribaculaceae bacterium]
MRHNISFPLFLLPFTLLAFSSCSSTETFPDRPEERSNLVNLSVSTPDSYIFGHTTRADDGNFQLRLKAWLYPLNEDGKAEPDVAPTYTYETLHSDNETTLSFEIDNPGEYCVFVFADYIPVGAEADNGHFPDKYYDTTIPGKITIKAAGNDDNIKDFFNTDNRDCFIGKLAFTKKLNSISKELKLSRPISRVLLTSTADAVEQLIESIDITACSHLDTYNFTIDNTDTVGTVTETPSDPLKEYGEVKVNPVNKELFYFYTFAGEYADDNRAALGAISFALNARDNIKLENDTRTVAEGLIKPAQNYKITVNGSKGWISAEAGADDIIVNIDLSTDWTGTINK